MQGEIDLNPFRRRLKRHGVAAQARVLSIGTPKWQDVSSSCLTHDYVVEVQPEGEEPFTAELRDSFSAFMAPKPGDLLQVKYNPKSRKVAFALEGDPRYDLPSGPRTWTPPPAPSVPAAAAPMVMRSLGAVVAGPSPLPSGAAERIERLGALRDQGLITAEEFQTQKARLLPLL